MPWELGFFDGLKHKAAILPVLETWQITNKYEGQEYLGVYPYITKDSRSDTGEETLWVSEDENRYILFSAWLNGYEPFRS
jgi:hypothetical protein